MLADAAEEIGLSEAELESLRPVAVVTNDDTGSALVVYRADLTPGAEPHPDPGKVGELRWAPRPADLGAQVSGDTLACWEAIERFRQFMSRDQSDV